MKVLSVVIPSYNYDCSRLVQQLLQQLPQDAEIIVGDDCSTDAETVRRLAAIASLPHCRLYRPDHNLGRASIRNVLAREASGKWLMFVDADAEVRSDDFISTYLSAAREADVVCGGTGNLPSCPDQAMRLCYDYVSEAERRLTLSHRRQHPYDGFTTFNFLILRSLFLAICFDEGIKEYGHEDTLFGLELKQRGIKVHHIDNKLTHLGLEVAEVFLAKTETALRTLSSMELCQQQNVRVSALALRLQRQHLLGFVRLVFKLLRTPLRANLLGKHPSQKAFAFYKLGYFAQCMHA